MHLTFTPEQQLLHKLKNVATRPKANTNKRAITAVTGATCIEGTPDHPFHPFHRLLEHPGAGHK